MKKIQILGVAIVALFAFSMMLASMASAETTLLAEWLNNGVAVGSSIASVSKGEITLEDEKEKIAVLCSGEFHGTVGSNGEGIVTSVTGLATTPVINLEEGKLLACSSDKFCESGTDITASPEKLPWSTLLVLEEKLGTFLTVFFGSAYFTECLVLGIKVSEECSATQTGGEVKNATGGVEAVGKPSPNANCTLGGTEEGTIEFAAGNITTVSPGPLTVSE